ncbi:MAG: type II secretion system protein GspM [Hyphomonadaceae bacterium]
MNGDSEILKWFRGLTAREQGLVAALGALCLVLACVYIGLLPGLDAMRNAESRRRAAAVELSEVRDLANEVTWSRARAAEVPLERTPDIMSEAASDYGVELLRTRTEDGVVYANVSAINSGTILKWVAEVSSRAAIGSRSLAISRAQDGRIVSEVAFTRSTS